MDLKMGGANFWIGQVDLRNVPERGSCGRGPEIGRSLSKLKSNKNKKYTIVSLDLLIYRTFSSFNLEIQLLLFFSEKLPKWGEEVYYHLPIRHTYAPGYTSINQRESMAMTII